MNVLVIAAHPDDEVLGCGGTMAAHAAKGDTIDILFVADGETGRRGISAIETRVADRQEAARAAAASLGAQEPRFLNFPDNRLDTIPFLDIVQALEDAVQGLAPAIVYTHHCGDLNIDHHVVGRATLTLYRPLPGSTVRAIRGFEVLSSTHWGEQQDAFNPTLYVDIDRVLDSKMSALRCYSTEIRTFPHARSIEAVEALARFRGASCGFAAAEAFIVFREVQRIF